MVTARQAGLALLILQIYVSAAPSDTPKLEEIAKVEHDEPKLDSPASPTENHKKDSQSTETQRQKRFYNPYGFGFPPINPVQYPSYNKRDQASELGLYGLDDPLTQIHRRLQEIASNVREQQQPPPPPPPYQPHFPLFFPVIFVPHQFGCHCSPSPTPQVTPKPDTTQPTSQSPVVDGTTAPDIFNRWPDMEDERQNWGLYVNKTEEDLYSSDNGEDGSRPISFDPIVANQPMSRPPPPVEHGSSQAGADPSTTTVRPRPTSSFRPREDNDVPRPPAAAPAAAAAGASSGPYPPSSAGFPGEAPTTCDGAVLSCCHQLQVTYDCFAILGCPDPTSYGNPCNPSVILKVIEKYQKFYGVRNGK